MCTSPRVTPGARVGPHGSTCMETSGEKKHLTSVCLRPYNLNLSLNLNPKPNS